ncbi:MAG: YraN family protein [Lachnospiraceae bacterium]|nr:YraN family protein [Lachnospiraceae bacterium]MDE7021971.1 YraN family protein [Lachnospiraceae bacterium]
MNKRKIGEEQETRACQHLIEQGVKIRERNFRCRQGEIDIIGCERDYLVFIEVKYRRDDAKGCAAEAVGFRKQRKICRVADYYRMIHGCALDTPIRFDVIAIDGGRIEWIRDAFPYIAG